MVLEIFSARVREARLANGLVQADLASLLGVRTKAITDYEAGSYLPKPPMLEKMSDVLKQPVAWFFTPGVLTFTCCNTHHLSQTTCPTCGRRILEGDFRPLDTLPPALQEAHRKAWRPRAGGWQ